MTLAVIAVIFCLVLLVWSADRFVDGSASQGNLGIALGNVYGSNITIIALISPSAIHS